MPLIDVMYHFLCVCMYVCLTSSVAATKGLTNLWLMESPTHLVRRLERAESSRGEGDGARPHMNVHLCPALIRHPVSRRSSRSPIAIKTFQTPRNYPLMQCRFPCALSPFGHLDMSRVARLFDKEYCSEIMKGVYVKTITSIEFMA